MCPPQHLPWMIPQPLALDCPAWGYAPAFPTGNSPALGARQHLRPGRPLSPGGLAFGVHWRIHLGAEQLGWFSPQCSSSLWPATPAEPQLPPHFSWVPSCPRRCPEEVSDGLVEPVSLRAAMVVLPESGLLLHSGAGSEDNHFINQMSHAPDQMT